MGRGGKMKNFDFIKVLINKGLLKVVGLDSNFNNYRILEYQGKQFKLTLEEIENEVAV